MINYAEKYAGKVDERFSLGAMTAQAVNQDYDWSGSDTVHVYSVPTVAMGDYTMDGASRYGTASELQDSVQTMTLTRDRSFTFSIDRRNYSDTMMTKEAGKALARQMDEVVIPEIDIYRLGKLCAGAGTVATGAITKTNAYESLLTAQTALAEHMVPTAGRICYVSPHFYRCIKLDDGFIKASDLGQALTVSGQIGQVDGVPLVLLPSSYLPQGVEFLLTHPTACVSPIKLAEYKVHNNPVGISGWVVEGRFYYDAFVLDNKVKAIYVHKNA